MPLWRSFWRDESGAIVSAELIAVSTLGVMGGTVGLNMLSTSVEGEFRDLSHAVRSLNQSYFVTGHSSPQAWTASSCYTQRDVRLSLEELDTDFIGDRPAPLNGQPEPAGKRNKNKKESRRSDEIQEEAAFLQPDESSAAELNRVEPEDDASQVETTIEPATDA